MNPQDLQTAQASGMAPIFYSPNEVKPDIPAATPQQTNLPSKGNWFERNAQTLGGILGGIGGAIAAPFTGGVINPVDAAAAGAGIGQEVKNKTTGTTTNPFEEAAIGGASELAGGVLGAGAKLAGKALNKASPDLFRSAFNIPNKLASRLDPNGTAQAMLRYNIGGSLNNMVDKSNSAMDVLDNIYRQSVGTITDKVSTAPVSKASMNMLNDIMTTDLTDADKQQVVGVLDRFLRDENGHLQLDPQEAVTRMRALQNSGHTLLAKGENKLSPNPRLSQLGQAYLTAGDTLQSTLDSAPTSGSIKDLMTDANLAPIREISPTLADELSKATTHQEIRSLMSPFQRLKTMAKITIDNPKRTGLLAGATGAAAGFGLGGPLGAMAGMLGSPIIQGAENAINAPLTTGAAKLLNNATRGVAENAAEGLTAKDAIGTALSQGTGQATSQLFGANSQMPSAPPEMQNGTSSGGISDLVSNSINNTMTPLNAAKTGSSTNIPSLAELLQAGGTNGLDAFLAYQKQESPQLTDQQQKDWMDAQNAMSDIQAFSKVYDKAAAKGAAVGQLEMLGAKIPGVQNLGSVSAIKAYEDNKGDLASSLASILGGGKNSKAMLSELKTELPDITDSPQTAAMKLHVIVQRLGQHMNTILAAPATNTPGQLANFAGQTVPGTVNFGGANSLPASPSQVSFAGGL